MTTIFERPSAPFFVEAWVPVGDSTVAVVEIDDPVVNDLEATLVGYGEPDTILTNSRYVVGAFVRDRVYAGRGIALSVAEPLEPADPAVPGLWLTHVQLFQAGTLTSYVTTIGPAPGANPQTHGL